MIFSLFSSSLHFTYLSLLYSSFTPPLSSPVFFPFFFLLLLFPLFSLFPYYILLFFSLFSSLFFFPPPLVILLFFLYFPHLCTSHIYLFYTPPSLLLCHLPLFLYFGFSFLYSPFFLSFLIIFFSSSLCSV